jgi:anti-sigma regulatory factor (Ser/Thr protein kinase)
VTVGDLERAVHRAGPPRQHEAEQPGRGHAGQADQAELDGQPPGLGHALVPGQREGPGALAPQPGLGELPALAESVRAAGLPVRLVVDGDGAALPAAVDVSAYRIVQEALTNVLKHAGSAHAEVSIAYVGDSVTIEITDDGPGLQAADPAGAEATQGGRGLTGMRERVALFGGDLRAGPRPDGGFTVRASLPVGDGAS